MKILAVDDDADILEVLRLILRADGFTDLTTATSADEALDLIKSADGAFDCFLIDIQMPWLNGIELCRRIRKMPSHRKSPVLMITAMSDRPHVDSAFVAGATDYLTKPFDITELKARVRSAEQTVTLQKRAAVANARAQEAEAMLEDTGRFPLREPFDLEDVDGLINYLALENYLLQLSRGDLMGTCVVALRVVDVGTLYAKSSAALYSDILAYVAESAIAALSGTSCALAHAGNGVFAGTLSLATPPDLEEIEAVINGILAGLNLLDDSGSTIDVKVQMGVPHQLGLMHSGRGAVRVLHRAIDEVMWPLPPKPTDSELSMNGMPKGVLKLFRRIH